MSLFVYGTLRTGGTLEPHYPLGGTRHPATLTGFRLHYVDRFGAYPVIVPHAGERVLGEVIYDPNPFVLRQVLEMETNVGYLVEPVLVHDDTEPPGIFTDARTCVWPYRPGAPIHGGDWLARWIPQ